MSMLGWDRILTASKDNNAAEIRQLVVMEGVSPSHSNGVGQSAIHVAALWGNISAVQTLISLGANLNAQNKITGGTPLHCLSTSMKKPVINRMECARILIKAGADPTQGDSYGSMPINYVDEFDVPEPELIECFPHFQNKTLAEVLQEGVPKLKIFDFIHDGDVEAVHTALREESEEDLKAGKDSNGNGLVFFTIQQILKHFGDDEDTQTTAELSSLLNILTMILAITNLDPNVTNKDGEIPLHLLCYTLNLLLVQNPSNSKSQYLEKTITTLFQYNGILVPKTIQLLHDAARRGNTKMIQFMVEKLQVDPNTKGRQGLTPIHFAARSGRLEALEQLIESGAVVNVEDDRGKTPMDYAIANSKDDIIKVLKAQL